MLCKKKKKKGKMPVGIPLKSVSSTSLCLWVHLRLLSLVSFLGLCQNYQITNWDAVEHAEQEHTRKRFLFTVNGYHFMQIKVKQIHFLVLTSWTAVKSVVLDRLALARWTLGRVEQYLSKTSLCFAAAWHQCFSYLLQGVSVFSFHLFFFTMYSLRAQFIR